MNRLKNISLPSLPSLPFSSSAPASTPPPLADERLAQLATRRDAVQSLLNAFASFHHTIDKKRPHPANKTFGGSPETALPLQWLAQEMVDGGHELVEQHDPSEEYGIALQAVGEVHLQLAKLTVSYHDALALSFLAALELKLDDFKDFDRSVKDADKARAALEALLTKVQKAKKDKQPDLEGEVESAEHAYEDACDVVARKADALDAGVDREVQSLQDLLDAELEYSTKYTSLLTECRAAWTPRSSQPRRSSPIHSRATSLAVPRSTRMARSQSDTSAMQDVADKAAALTPARGPGSRRTTVSNSSAAASGSSSKSEGGKEDSSSSPKSASRSRSGSMLSRFTGGGKKDKERKAKGAAADHNSSEDEDRDLDDAEESAHHTDGLEPGELDDADSYRSVSPAPFGGLALPSMPSLGSLRKLGAGNPASRYNTLNDDGPSSSSSRPPPFKRTQTAPPLNNTSSSLSLSRSRGSSFSATTAATYEAKWAFSGDATDPSELPLDKGDVVRVERHVNPEWWIGTIVSGSVPGRHGMFPSAFVTPVAPESEYEEEQEVMGGRADDGVSWTLAVDPPRGTGSPGAGRKAPPPPPTRRRGTVSGSSSPFAD